MICLMPNCCFLSETSRVLEIYRALAARGAPVRVATHGGTYEWVLRDADVAYDVIGPGLDPQRCAAFVRSVPGLGPPDQSMWTDDELRSYAKAEADYFRGHDVRVAVTGWTLTALLSTRLVGIPLVTEHAGTYLPPVFERGLLPEPSMPVGPPRWLPAAVRRWLVNKGAERLTIHLGGFNRVAGELGVAPVPSLPALLMGDLTLVTDVPEVLGIPADEIAAWRPRDPSRYRPNPRMRYTGPLFAHLSAPMPERVKRLLAEPEPVIYVAITSSPPTLVRAVVNALRPLGARILVAATVHDLDDLADDAVTVERVLPSHEIMPQVDLAVVAGGQGSVQTALASGLPFIGLPLQPEQDANVVMAERQGAARRLPTRSAGTERLTRLAQTMLADPTYRTNARRIANIFAKVDGPGAAADAILELAV